MQPILLARLPQLKTLIETFNKKANKFNLPEMTLNIGDIFSKDINIAEDRKIEVEYVNVDVIGERPQINGWQFVASKEVQPNGESLFKGITDEVIPEKYKHSHYECEHCNINRLRHSVVIIRNIASNEYKQVGTSCLADFLAVKTINDYLNYYGELNLFLSASSELEDEDYEGFCKSSNGYDTLHFLTLIATTIRLYGWLSSGKAQDQQKTSTVNTLLNVLSCKDVYSLEEKAKIYSAISEDDKELAKNALNWARNIPTTESGYLYNLGVACRQNITDYSNSGLVGSAIVSYKMTIQKESDKITAKQIKHVGIVGQRSIFPNLKVISKMQYPGNFGMKTLVKFNDSEGNLLVWWATGNAENFEENTTITVKATVKEHAFWKNQSQTVLSVVKIV